MRSVSHKTKEKNVFRSVLDNVHDKRGEKKKKWMYRLSQCIVNPELHLFSFVKHRLFDQSALMLFHRRSCGYGQEERFRLAPDYSENFLYCCSLNKLPVSVGVCRYTTFFFFLILHIPNLDLWMLISPLLLTDCMRFCKISHISWTFIFGTWMLQSFANVVGYLSVSPLIG